MQVFDSKGCFKQVVSITWFAFPHLERRRWGNDAEDFPGERWQHYFVKDRAHGFKCLKCSLVGRDISDLRDKDCKIPRPSGPSPSPTSTAPTSPAPTSTSALHPNALGASAAVVGEKAALDGAATRVLEEMRQLERVERDLAHELEYQALLEEEESLELAMLESELAQLELLREAKRLRNF